MDIATENNQDKMIGYFDFFGMPDGIVSNTVWFDENYKIVFLIS